MKVKCPKCDYHQIIVSFWGTAYLSIIDGDIVTDIIDYQVDDKEYCECPDCEYKGSRSEFLIEEES